MNAKNGNGIGTQVPTQEQIDALIANVATIGQQVGPYTVALGKAERISSTKMRLGGEHIIATVGQLAEQHNVSLPDVTPSSVNDALLLSQRLRPLADAVQQLDRRLKDTLLAATSESWNGACALYLSLARSASNNPNVEAAIQPVIAFFAKRSPKKTTVSTPAPVPAAPAAVTPVKSAA